MAHFGEILADLRRDKGLQQKELGKELHIAGSTISSYERGINLPNADRIIQIANCFDVTTDYLLGRTPYNVPPTIINKPFVNGLTNQDVLVLLEHLPMDRREAFALLISDSSFSTSVRSQAEFTSKGQVK